MSLIENKSLIRAENEQFVRAVSLVSTQIQTKARLGAVAQSFDPDAIDGDGDGLVQDGSPFERPAVIGAISKASQRLGQILGKAKQTKQGRTREYNRRHNGMSAKDIATDVVPDSFEGWAASQYELLRLERPDLPALTDDLSPQQVTELVRALEDFVEPTLVLWISEKDKDKFQELKKTDRNAAFRFLLEGSFDFSPKAVAKNRRLVEHVLTTNPQIRELVNKFGMPAVTMWGELFRSGVDADAITLSTGGISLNSYRSPTSSGKVFSKASRRLANWLLTGLMPPDVGSKDTKRWISRDASPEARLLHEYGHYLSNTIGKTLPDSERYSMDTPRAIAWRFSIGASWKETFNDIGWPEAYDAYSLPNREQSERREVPSDIPHILTGYGESSPSEAFAESISAVFAHNGEEQHLVSEGMKSLIRDALELQEGDLREQLTPKRATREIIPDGFASRGATVAINNERDSRYGELTDPYELTAEVLGTLDGDDPVGAMVRRLQEIKDDPEQYDRLLRADNAWSSIDVPLNIRRANEAEAALLASVIIDDPAFADMIRRHGVPNYYFSQTDLKLKGDHDVRGILSGGYVADDSPEGKFYPPRIVIDLIGAEHERGTPDSPYEPDSAAAVREFSKGRAPGNVTRKFVSRSDKHVIRHEGGHGVLDQLWEKQNDGKITGRRATLIRAYSKSTWEEFYKELGRPDLWAEHQRALKATYPSQQGTLERAFRRVIPGNPNVSDEIQQVDSAYAWSNPKEMFAEGFSAYTASNPAFRGLLNDTMIDHFQSILGDADNPDVPEPPSMPEIRDLDTDIPEPPAWEGFPSTGEPIKSYAELRNKHPFRESDLFKRSDLFLNTTTEQKVDLAVPDNENDWALMAWDQIFERMGMTNEEVRRIDLSDPYNPQVPRKYREALEGLEMYARTMKRDMPDFSPDVVKTNREALRATLDAYPRLREVSDQLGMPPVTTMSDAVRQRATQEFMLSQALSSFRAGRDDINPAMLDALPAFMEYSSHGDWDRFRNTPEVAGFIEFIERIEADGSFATIENSINGGYSPANETFLMPRALATEFSNGTRLDHKFAPQAGDWNILDGSYESILLHEYGHYVHSKLIDRAKKGDRNAVLQLQELTKQFDNAEANVKTEYARTIMREYAAETIAAVMSGSRDAESLLSPEARQWARGAALLPERDPVFAGRTPGMPPSADEMLTDRFGELWTRTRDGMLEAVDAAKAKRSRDGVPDVLETMVDAKKRTGLTPFDPVEFDHDGRKFTIQQANDTFSIEINGRTVATANVVEGTDGLPEINNVDVLPGYTGVAPDKDLHEMIVDHARKKYPSARAPRRARQTAIEQEGFASVGPEHYDARQIDGTPGTPEYAQAAAGEFEAARASGKKVFFDYNGETREVEVTDVFEKNGVLYMKGNDALRNGEERMFRLDRVSMPKRVENPDTGAAEVVKKPGKPPRKPVPVFTGKAAALFEGATSWEEVAARLGKGRYVFFDFETTGIEADEFGGMQHPGTPTQIGLTEIIDGQITRQWSTHVNPGRPLSIDPKTGRSWSADNLKYKDPVTGELKNISDEWLATQRPLSEALDEMLEFIGPIEDTILGGQNHPYDDDVMKRAMSDAGLDPARWSPGGFIDSQALAQALLDKNSDDYPVNEKGGKTVSLGYLAKFLGHDMGDGWHSADADAEASYEAFKRLIERAALHENSGKPVRRDLFAPGGALTEHQERLNDYERQMSGWSYKVKKYKESQAAAAMESPATEGFASTGSADAPRRKAVDDPDKLTTVITPSGEKTVPWKNLTPDERKEMQQSSAESAAEFIEGLIAEGYAPEYFQNMTRQVLEEFIRERSGDLPGVGVSDYQTPDGKPIVEVTNATMGKVFMALGMHVSVNTDDPNEKYILDGSMKELDDLLKKSLGKEIAAKLQVNMCLYYKAETNVLCGDNIGVNRVEMPQLSGRMDGDDTLAADALKSGLMVAKDLVIDKDKLSKLDADKQKQLTDLAKDPAKVAELAKANDPLAKELFDVLNWNDTETSIEPILDKAAEALGIVVKEPEYVDPETMLGAQNELQAAKIDSMAANAVKAVERGITELTNDLGRPPTQEELMEFLKKLPMNQGGGLFQPTLVAGLPGGQTYMLDGHHRWAGLLVANERLAALGIDYRVQLGIRKYETDIRTGLELGRSIQKQLGVKDAALGKETPYAFTGPRPAITEADFNARIMTIIDKDNAKKQMDKVKDSGQFRKPKSPKANKQSSQAGPPRDLGKPQDVAAALDVPSLEPQSRVAGVKPQSTGYRALDSGMKWNSVEEHLSIETERGNQLFDTYKEYVNKGYEVAWVTHSPKEAGRYAISADQVNAFDRDEITVDPANIGEVDLAGAILVGKDDEGGFLYARRKQSKAVKQRVETLKNEESYLDAMLSSQPADEGFASTGTLSIPLDLVVGGGPTDSKLRGGAAQRDRDVVVDDWDTRQRNMIAGVRVPDREVDEFGSPVPGAPIYRETVKIGRKKYTFEADVNGIVSVYEGRDYKQVAQLNLDRGHSMLSGSRRADRDRHYIDFVEVNKKHRRKGIATQMAEIAEHAYGGRVEHSTALSDAGRAWRDADVRDRGAAAIPLRDGASTIDSVFEDGFASRGNYMPLPPPGDDDGFSTDSTLEKIADRIGLDQLPDGKDRQMSSLTGRLFAGTDEATLAEKLGITPEQLREQLEELAGNVNEFIDRFINDKEVRRNVKLGYKILGSVAMIVGAKDFKSFLSTLNPNLSGGGDGSGQGNSLLDILDQALGASIHEALIAYGSNFANLIATEFAAMRLASQEKMKQMITDIQARIEGTGQKIGVMSTEMWNRLRGAWKQTRAKAPIAVPSGAKQWIVAGSTPAWAEMSWVDYQSKSRITSHLQPTNKQAWAEIASKVGQSPELIDIATYRAGFGYGEKRVKPRDVVRVYF